VSPAGEQADEEEHREVTAELALEPDPRSATVELDEAAEGRAMREQPGRSACAEGGGGVHTKVIGVPRPVANPWRE
jgi:hypothetical protein